MQDLAPHALDRIAHDEQHAGVRRQCLDMLEAFAAENGIFRCHFARECRQAAMLEQPFIPDIVDGVRHVVAVPGPLAAVLGKPAPLRPHALMILAIARTALLAVQVLGNAGHVVEIVDLFDGRNEEIGMAGEHTCKPRRARLLGADADEVILDHGRRHAVWPFGSGLTS